MKTKGKFILVTLLIVFGLITLFLSGSVIFDLFGIREMEGNYVPAVVWVNFLASILYLITAYGILIRSSWIVITMWTAVGVLIIGQILFFIHIVNGGIYETKTVSAMIFRIAFTVLLTILAIRLRWPQNIDKN